MVDPAPQVSLVGPTPQIPVNNTASFVSYLEPVWIFVYSAHHLFSLEIVVLPYDLILSQLEIDIRDGLDPGPVLFHQVVEPVWPGRGD